MNGTRSTKKILLALTDDREALAEIVRCASTTYEVLSSRDTRQALAWLQNKAVYVLVTDNRPEQFDGDSFLDHVRHIAPTTRRIVLTPFTDLYKLIQGLHSGAIQNLVQNPIIPQELLNAIAIPDDVPSSYRKRVG